MNVLTFETHDLRVRIEGSVAQIDQRRLDGDPWRQIDQTALPVSEHWLTSLSRTSPLKVALRAFELENPGDITLRNALELKPLSA